MSIGQTFKKFLGMADDPSNNQTDEKPKPPTIAERRNEELYVKKAYSAEAQKEYRTKRAAFEAKLYKINPDLTQEELEKELNNYGLSPKEIKQADRFDNFIASTKQYIEAYQSEAGPNRSPLAESDFDGIIRRISKEINEADTLLTNAEADSPFYERLTEIVGRLEKLRDDIELMKVRKGIKEIN